MNELYVQKLIRLVERGVITIEQIQDPTYKAEIESRNTRSVIRRRGGGGASFGKADKYLQG